MTTATCRNCGTTIKNVDGEWEHDAEAPVDSACWSGDAGPEPEDDDPDAPTFLEGPLGYINERDWRINRFAGGSS